MNKELFIELLASAKGVSVEEVTSQLDKLKVVFGKGNSEYESLVNVLENLHKADCIFKEEPLWVRNQHNKTFKRGKNF
jgi:hypothetical protein